MVVLLVLSSLMFLPFLGASGIVNSSDGYYTEAAREMLERNDFLTPYLNYEPFYDKPILAYWLIILSYKIFGVSTFAARLPSALCAIFSVGLLYVLTRPLLNFRASLYSALSLLTMPLFVVTGHLALTDAPLMLFTIVGVLSLFSVENGGGSFYLFGAYVALGLAFLCKGPISLVVCTIAIGGYIILVSDRPSRFLELFKRLKPLLAFSILVIVVLPWFAIEHVVTHGDFTRSFFIEQNFGRATGTFASHRYSWWFYIPFIAGGFFPWSTLLLQSPLLLRLKKKHFSDTLRARLLKLALVWLLGTMAFLSVAASKLPTYLLPTAPALAIIAGCYLDKIVRLNKRSILLWTVPTFGIGAIVSILVVPQLVRESLALKPLVIASVLMLSVGIVFYSVMLFKSKIRFAVGILLASCFLACSVLVPAGTMIVYRRNLASQHKLLIQASSVPNASLAIYGTSRPGSAFYAGQRVFEVETEKDFSNFLADTKSPHLIVVPSKNLERVRDEWSHNTTQINHKGDWYLLRVSEENLSL
ncbi:MAG: glycosyltransferase family 39 protein [Candidatus Obscuribacterales bacterium]|nr:glycosyltransferase family 39 protein [Candidatus Obscuribacterales bacterium]